MDQLTGDDGTVSTATVEITTEATGTFVVHVVGELDISNVASLRSAVEPIRAGTPNRVIFDFEGLRFMDSSTLALLVEWSTSVCPIEIRNPSRPIRRVIELTGLADILNLES